VVPELNSITQVWKFMSVLILNMSWTFFFWWNPSLIHLQTAKPVVFEPSPCLKRIWSIATRTKGGGSAFGPGTANARMVCVRLGNVLEVISNGLPLHWE
jgi:hypothetical protein